MLADFDDACAHAGVQPDAVVSGHAHNYQRHTRRVGAKKIPFLVAGCGGHNDSRVDPADGQLEGDHSFDKSFTGFGYLTVTVSQRRLKLDFTRLGTRRLVDTTSVRLS
jgi:hypothetical protein